MVDVDAGRAMVRLQPLKEQQSEIAQSQGQLLDSEWRIQDMSNLVKH